MELFTIDSVPGKEFTALGLVKGATVQTKHIGRDLMAGLKNVLGGELKGYTEMMQESRQIATQRMCKMAAEMGADAVIGVRYATSAVMPQAAEVLAYGTAVKFDK